ncbi:MAG: Coenzyme F420 hydrogenase/dehydrogenase, beta subunit C-terminal domain [Desulfobacteraceae bacterium]
MQKEVIDRGTCVNCGTCAGLCACFQSVEGETVQVFPCDQKTGECYTCCPLTFDALKNVLKRKSVTDVGSYKEIWSSRMTGKNKPISSCQNGGTVSALVETAIRYKMINAAVLTGGDQHQAIPELIDDAKKVAQFASSKYTMAPTVSTLLKNLASTKRGLGFVGMPCQIRSVGKLLKNSRFADQLLRLKPLTIGLFCSWSLNELRMNNFFKEKQLRHIQRIDISAPPDQFVVLKSPSKNFKILLKEFQPLFNSGCSYCPDLTSEDADLSVGVNENEPNWNILIIRNDRGKKLVDLALKKEKIQIKPLPQKTLIQLYAAAKQKRKKAINILNEKCCE